MIANQQNRCEELKSALMENGLFAKEGDGNIWRISPEPYFLRKEEVRWFHDLGNHLLRFYAASNHLYIESIKGRMPSWIANYLDQGKPDDLIELSRMKRFKSQLPGIIRPDVIALENGFVVTELDSVPGGFGRTAGLMSLYADRGVSIVGEENGGIPQKLARMLETVAGKPDCVTVIAVSDEASDYLEEMQYLSEVLMEQGHTVHVRHPKDILFREDGLAILDEKGNEVSIDVLYRFYELFDLKNIPKSELLAYATKKAQVKTTPPYKPWLEEKLWFALFHHPSLKPWWEKVLETETFDLLTHLIPNTWILDPRPLPPQAVIPGLQPKGHAIQSWSALESLTQKERQLVIKTSGFSPSAWGSRGVVIGHDVSSEEWEGTLKARLEKFSREPSIVQEFHKGKRVQASWWNEQKQSLQTMNSRVRLTPYYFIVEGQSQLGGILATLCPDDKKKIHGMVDAIMVPCAEQSEEQANESGNGSENE